MFESNPKKIVLENPPSCEFIFRNIADERKAIHEYLQEARRTAELPLQYVFQKIAEDEMHHLEVLDDLATRIGCKRGT